MIPAGMFRYARPQNLRELLALIGEYGSDARLLAGGTDLLVHFRSRRALPRIVVDLKRVSDLPADIVDTGQALRIGARVVLTDVIEDPRVRRHFPALVEAASVVGSVQIRNRATLTGNICNASPAADTAPALLAYGAVANLVGLGGQRGVLLADFFLGPGRTVLNRGEIVESIDVPYPPKSLGASFGRIARRRGIDVATVNLCCVVKTCGEVAFACGAVGPRPFVVYENTGIFTDVGPPEQQVPLQRLIEQASPISDVRAGQDYRLAMLAVLGRRCLADAIARLRSASVETLCKR